MVLCRLGAWRGREMWPWHTSLLLLLGLGPASLLPPFSLHPAAAGSSLYLLARSRSQTAASATSLGQSPGGATFSLAHKAILVQTTAPILRLHTPVLEKPSSSCSWVRVGSASSSLTSCFPAILCPALLPPKKELITIFLKDEI